MMDAMKRCIFLQLIFLIIMTCNVYAYYSQIGQDKYLNEQFFKNKQNGFFVDIGAHDGISLSNTYFFEKHLRWTGICFEPLPQIFPRLKQNRDCICINACVAPIEGMVKFMIVEGWAEMFSGMLDTYDPRHLIQLQHHMGVHGGSSKIIELPAVQFNKTMDQYGVTHIDYLSIDTEGGELDILKSIHFEKIRIDAISVENNFHDKDTQMFLESKGFKLVASIEWDEIYINQYARESI